MPHPICNVQPTRQPVGQVGMSVSPVRCCARSPLPAKGPFRATALPHPKLQLRIRLHYEPRRSAQLMYAVPPTLERHMAGRKEMVQVLVCYLNSNLTPSTLSARCLGISWVSARKVGSLTAGRPSLSCITLDPTLRAGRQAGREGQSHIKVQETAGMANHPPICHVHAVQGSVQSAPSASAVHACQLLIAFVLYNS
jgi:hypothetical protein